MITQKLRYTGLRGETIEAEGSAGVEVTVHPNAIRYGCVRSGLARTGWLDSSPRRRPTSSATGIDNEILTGLRMYRMAGSDQYPPEITRLVGYSADDVEPFVLVESCRGVPIIDVASKLLTATAAVRDQPAHRIALAQPGGNS